ncbi:MAG TPA: hypothetical protein VFB63_06100 [Bryobacteraceae bacterium]|nr:hypothetical protein [Bryobacteraceae bacterium]
MRSIALFLFASLIASAAELTLTTGQAARLVIGQPTFTAATPGASESLLGAISGLAYANDTLFVVDANRIAATPVNHRVLLFNNLSSQIPRPEAELEVNFNRCQICVGSASLVLGQPDFAQSELKAASATTMRTPGAVATDGRVMAVSDSDNNRVLIWRSIPTNNQQPADVVLGQPDFTRVVPNDGGGFTPNNRSFKGPQGLWIQDGKLYVADTGNNRVLVWNSIPNSNFQPADLVLGAPDFNTFVQPDLTKAVIDAQANTLLTPVAVSSDGIRLYVSDLGHNRVLIWNSIPTRNQQPADVVLGQKTMTTAVANNVRELCASTGTDDDGNATYPAMCSSTMDFPRFALSDGKQLFIADGGNDRILVYKAIPTENGAPADAVLGQVRDTVNTVSDSADPDGVASSGVVRTPLSLAFDGRNLYASDPFNRRVMVFTMAERRVPNTGVRNSASREVFAVASVSFAGEVKENDEVEIKIRDRSYKYKAVKDDTFGTLIDGLVNAINSANGGAGDVDVLAIPNKTLFTIIFTARVAGEVGNQVEFTVTQTAGTTIVPTTSGAFLAGGQDAAKIAPGTVVAILGEDLADTTAAAPDNAEQLPRELAGVQVYFDGIRAPLYFVSPTEIRAQMPWEVNGSQSANAVVRTVRRDGITVSVTSAISVPLVRQNPGIFAEEGVADPRPGIVLHGSSFATATISVDGSIRKDDVATVTIEDRKYNYTVVEGDTLASVRDRLIELINQDPKVEAYPAAAFTRIRLRARVAGPEFNNIAIAGSSREGDQVIITATNSQLCCANTAGARVTEDNPAVPGETIIVMGTGLGNVKPDEAYYQQVTGRAYDGVVLNDPVEFVSSLAGGKTANVLSAGLMPGTVGLYQVVLELNSDLPTNPQTQMTIAQDVYVSNIVTFAVLNKNPAN